MIDKQYFGEYSMLGSDRTRAVLIVIACFSIVLIAIATWVYPDDWVLPLPLAAVFGPFIGMRMGFGECAVYFMASILLMAPIAKWQNLWTAILLMVGLCLWFLVGCVAGGWLYA